MGLVRTPPLAPPPHNCHTHSKAVTLYGSRRKDVGFGARRYRVQYEELQIAMKLLWMKERNKYCPERQLQFYYINK